MQMFGRIGEGGDLVASTADEGGLSGLQILHG